MLDAVLDDAADPALPLISAPATVAAARIGVYRNTAQRNLADALRSTYPAVFRLVGEAYFRQTARAYGRRHPSRCGELTHAGDAFPAYLAELHGDDEYRYLGDVARLELLIQDVLLAPEPGSGSVTGSAASTPGSAAVDLARLAAVPAGHHDSLRFVLHPALRLFESPYPVHRIWQSNVDSDAEPPAIDLASGGDRLAVLRQRLQLQFHRLSPGEWCWLEALGQGLPFAASLAAADAGFDAAAALQRFVALGVIVDFE
jgi:hypothetical protein